MLNALYDPQSVQTYYSEYLNLIKFYMNLKRPSSFVRYYNIDIHESTFDEKLDATYDLYHISNIKFNVYDFTPTYYLAPIVNTSANVPDLRGQMLDATTSVVTYTIKNPRIHDLVMFYSPLKSGEIFRVVNFRTPVNALHSDPSLSWFEMDLEYAPIKDCSILKVLNHYVYDLSQEKYITYTEYSEFIKFLDSLKILLNKIMQFYDTYHDLYQYSNLVPVEVNELFVLFKRQYTVKYRRLIDEFLLPYGYLDIVNFKPKYSSIDQLPFKLGNYNYTVYNLLTRKFEDYTWSVTYRDKQDGLDKLFLLGLELLELAYNWKII